MRARARALSLSHTLYLSLSMCVRSVAFFSLINDADARNPTLSYISNQGLATAMLNGDLYVVAGKLACRLEAGGKEWELITPPVMNTK